MNSKTYVQCHLNKLNEYLEGVLSNKIITNPLQFKAVERFLSFKKKYSFDEQELKRILKFCSLLNLPVNNEVKQLQLIGWQVFVIANLYCLYDEKGKRVFDLAYIEIAKKNGKTSLCGVLSLIDCLIDNELNASVLFVACSKDQANIALEITKTIINNSPAISGLFTINKNQIYRIENGIKNKIEVKASDSKLVQGSGVSLSIVDEYAFAPDSELQNKIKSGQIARVNPLQVIITTASNDKQSPAFQLRETCSNILNGVIEGDSIFSLIFDLNKEDIDSPENWIKSNPSIGYTIQLDSLVREYQTAKLIPSKLNTFITDNLNYWTDNLTTVWIEDDLIKSQMRFKNVLNPKLDTYIGLDISATSDLCSIGALQYNHIKDTFNYHCINIFPNNEKKRIRAGSIDLTRWITEGFILQSKLPVLDEDQVYDLLVDLSNNYNVISIGVDVWGSQSIQHKLRTNIKVNVNGVRQNLQSLSYPLKVCEKYLTLQKMNINQSPVLRWMFGNVKIYSDSNHNIKIDKRKNEAVDGVVALNIAMHEYLSYNNNSLDNLVELYK